MNNQHIIVNGLDIRYAERGIGPVILLLHGWGTSLETFSGLIEAWGDCGMRLIAPDLPGFGGSQVPSNAWSVSDYASFVQSFLSKLGVDRLQVLIGHSLGGRIAIKGVSRGNFAPDRLVLIASAGVAKRQSSRNFIFMAVAKAGKALAAIPPFSFFKERMRKKLYAAAGSSDYMNAGHMKETFLKIVREDLTQDASRITIPTLLLWGENDTETPLEEARSLHHAIKNSRLEIVPEAGHFVHQEKSREVAEKLAAFTDL